MGGPISSGDRRSDPYDARAISGHLAGSATGVFGALPDEECIRAMVMAHPDNAATIWVGNQTGTVNGLTGMPVVAAGEILYYEGLGNLNILLASFDGLGDRLCWTIMRFG